jgi:hypothetical protein
VIFPEEPEMTEKTVYETLKAEGGTLVEQLKRLIHEGNVRRVVVQHQGRTVAEFPLTAGVLGAVLAPVAAAIGALVALLKDCTIQVERAESDSKSSEASRSAS